ncbi:hypothetical protein Tco_1405453 [Tanacetum coccineum]
MRWSYNQDHISYPATIYFHHSITDSSEAPDLFNMDTIARPICFYPCSLEDNDDSYPPVESIPLVDAYQSHHLNVPRKLLTCKEHGPLPAHRLASRHVSPRSPDHHPSSSSSSSDSSPVHSLGLDAPDQAHSGSLTRDVPPRLCYPPRREPRLSKAFHHWCAAPLSTLSPVDSVPSSTPVMGSLTHTRADLLPPRKRFRDSYSSEAIIEEDTEIDPIETKVDMELSISDGDDVRDYVEIGPRDVRDDTEEY